MCSFRVFRFFDFQVFKFFKTFLVPSFCLTFRNFFQRFRHSGAPLTFCNLNIPLLLFYTRTPNPWSTKKCNAWSTNIFNFQVFFNSSCIIHRCRTVDIPVGKVGPNQWVVSGRDRPRREGRVNQQKTEAETETAAESLLWPVTSEIWWRKSVSELWGHSERTVRKWRRNWRRRSPRQEQKEADIKNHLLHGTFVLFLLFLKLN